MGYGAHAVVVGHGAMGCVCGAVYLVVEFAELVGYFQRA